MEAARLLRPAEAPTACDTGDIRLPEIVATKGTRPDGLKNAETAWITAKGQGACWPELPEARSIVQVKKLWAHEARVGLHRDEKTLITGEGALYSPSYVRLRRGVALGVGVAGVPEGMAHVPDIFPLGGESRLAVAKSGVTTILFRRRRREDSRRRGGPRRVHSRYAHSGPISKRRAKPITRRENHFRVRRQASVHRWLGFAET